jgi:hypothetical protein
MDRAHFGLPGVLVFIQIQAGVDFDCDNFFDRGAWMNLANYMHYAGNVHILIEQVERALNIIADKTVTFIAVNNFTYDQRTPDNVGRVVFRNIVENVFHPNRIPIIAGV